MQFVVGLCILAAFAAALMDDHGRKVIAMMVAIVALVAVGIGLLLWALKVSENSNEPTTSYSSTDYANPTNDETIGVVDTEPHEKSDIELADEAFSENRYSDAAALYERIKIGPKGIALSRLAWMYYNGNGVPKNYEIAYRLYPKAAEHGDADAQAMLGYFYGNGIGFEKDILQAYIWSSVAAAQGNQTGINNRNIFEQQLTPEQVTLGQKSANRCAVTHYKKCTYQLPAPTIEPDQEAYSQG